MTRILCQPEGARGLDDPVAVNDCSVLTDKDRLADAKLFDAGANARDLRGFRPANATLCLAQLVDRHVGHRQPRQQIVAPLRGVIGDLGKRALALPASARLGFQIRSEAVGRSDDGFRAGSLGGHCGFLFCFRDTLSEKEEATTQPRNGIWASKQSIRPSGPRSHIFERPDIRASCSGIAGSLG